VAKSDKPAKTTAANSSTAPSGNAANANTSGK
jgi:hypothetical protein